MKMYDVERIGKIISDIERYFRDLELEGLNMSHEYYDLTEEDVLEVFKKISIVKKFVERMKEVLKE